jgi:hypothetical protein
LPDDPSRRAKVLATIHDIISAAGEPDPEETKKFREISRLFEAADFKNQMGADPFRHKCA